LRSFRKPLKALPVSLKSDENNGYFTRTLPVRTIIVIDNKVIKQVNSFIYLGNISYEKELDIDNKLHNYFKITGILNNVFRPQKNS